MNLLVRSLFATLLLGVGTANCYASIIVNANEVSGDVVFSGGGTADLTGLTLSSNVAHLHGAAANFSRFYFGVGVDSIFTGISGPVGFGPGLGSLASVSTGDRFGLDSANAILLPAGYVSGSPLFGTMTFAGQTFASIGLMSGTYDWTWGTGANADSLRLQIGVAAVPEPTSIALVGIGLAVAGMSRRRLRR